MAQSGNPPARKQRLLPLMGAAAFVALGVPSAGIAVAAMGDPAAESSPLAFDLFTPASVNPQLAARVAEKARERGIPFTPAGTKSGNMDRTVTVTVRIDGQSAQAVSVRGSAEPVAGTGKTLTGLRSSRFNLGTARGYESFTRSPAETAPAGRLTLPDSMGMPDLAEFEPSRPTRADKPSRLQPRIELEDRAIAGRSPNTLDALESQTVDVGGSFRLSRNLDVTAGVRYSQERERIDPLTTSVQDSQAVYVGTQIRF